MAALLNSPVHMSESIICERAFELARRILVLTDRMYQRGPGARHLASELVRSGTSIGANAEEAQEGQSKRPFIAKLSVSRKEARETLWWLRLAVAARYVSDSEVQWESSESRQLLRMIRSAIKTAHENSGSGPESD
jgi:four helix bundle protein